MGACTYHNQKVLHIARDGAIHFLFRRRVNHVGAILFCRKQRILSVLGDPRMHPEFVHLDSAFRVLLQDPADEIFKSGVLFLG